MDDSSHTFEGLGPWIAVGSELPCSVVALLLVGQIIGGSTGGTSGAIYGSVLGAIFGFILGIYGVFKTVEYLEHIEQGSQSRPVYMPSMEEILEDVVFDLDEESPE